MLMKVLLSREEFIDLMGLLGSNVERLKSCWKLSTGERLYWRDGNVLEVRGVSAVDNFDRLLSDFLSGVELEGFISYLVKYGPIRNKIRTKFWFNKFV